MIDIIQFKDEICANIYNHYKNTFRVLKVDYNINEFSFKVDTDVLHPLIKESVDEKIDCDLCYCNNKVTLDLYYNNIKIMYNVLTSDTNKHLKKLLDIK